MTIQHFKAATLLLPLAAALGGCASTPPQPTDPAQMTVLQRQLSGYSQCVRVDQSDQQIIIYPKLADVSWRESDFSYTWRCSSFAGEFQYLQADVSTHPIAETEKPGDGTIGAYLEATDKGNAVAWLMPNGSAMAGGELKTGDLIVAVQPTPDSSPVPTTGLSVNQVGWLIRGEPGTPVQLTVQSPDAQASRQVIITRKLGDARDLEAIEAWLQAREQEVIAEASKSLVIPGNSGQFMSPYTSDRVTAEWVNRALNANIGATAGSAIGAAAGAYAANKALESVPFGSLLGGMFGSSVGKNVGRSTAIEAIGGWDYVRSTSDMSFRTLTDMAQYLISEHGSDPNFGEVIKATSHIYPEFSDAFAAAR